ncbi:MAG: hypothetical protein K2X66_12445 [Cyanobacteria bacterium]|nr:hypothetical protein [Cyanobacteriota bacterium]
MSSSSSSSSVNTVSLSNQSTYAFLQRQRNFYNAFINKSILKEGAPPPPPFNPNANNGNGINALGNRSKAANLDPFALNNNPFDRIPLNGVPKVKLNTDNTLFNVNSLNKLNANGPDDFIKTTQGPNPVLDRLFRLSVPGVERGTVLTGPDASEKIDAKAIALTKGVQLQDLKLGSQPNGMLTPYMQELVRMLWSPSQNTQKNTQASQEYYNDFIANVRASFGNVEDPTTKQGPSTGFFSGGSGGMASGSETGGQSEFTGHGQKRHQSPQWKA